MTIKAKLLGILCCCALLVSCSEIPPGIKPVQDFKLNRYLGQWYEIARLDHRFERGLEQVTATYILNEDGSVKVVNRGLVTGKNTWKDAEGKARFAGDPSIGHLEVSFFGFFYGSYVIFELDQEKYQYAFVTGSENSLWFLSRTPKVSEELKMKFISRVEKAGYNTGKLIFVNQDQHY